MQYSEDGDTFIEVTDEQIEEWNRQASDTVSEVTSGQNAYQLEGEFGLDLPGKGVYATRVAPIGWPFKGRSAFCAKYWKRQRKNAEARAKRAARRQAKKRCECCGKVLDSQHS